LPGLVTTADAILKNFLDDPEWCRLTDKLNSIVRVPDKARQPKDDARDKRNRRENDLFNNVYNAVVLQKLQVLVAIDGTNTFQLPGPYLVSHEMRHALRTGWAETLRLTGQDTTWRGKRLVFTDENWRQWLENCGPLSVDAVRPSPKPKLSQRDKERLVRDYINRQPSGPINQSLAEKELMKTGLSREYVRTQLKQLARSRLRHRGRPPA
jgi:hypothetical protein